MFYFKNFFNHAEYEDFKESPQYFLPNVSVCYYEGEVYYNKLKGGYIRYKSSTKLVETTDSSSNGLHTNAFSGSSGQLNVIEHMFNGVYGLIMFNEPVTKIGDSAFRGCNSITEILIPSSVTSIGTNALYNCTSLNKINCEPLNPPTLGTDALTNTNNCAIYVSCNSYDSYVASSYWSAFEERIECTGGVSNNVIRYTASAKLEETSASDNGKLRINAFSGSNGQQLTITEHSFENGVGTIVFDDGVAYVGASAFHSCSGLTSVVIPNSVTNIGNSAFSRCSGLTSLAIPNSVTSIGDGTFSYCSGLTSVTIPNSVTSIGDSTFLYCKGLTSVAIGNNVTSIGNWAFGNCISLTSMTIPNSVTNIGKYAFQSCSGLTSVTIGNSVTSIGDYVFYGCSGLTSITIPNSLTNISNCAFYLCSGLVSVVIPNSVTSIEENAFYGCSSLSSITIPNSVTNIGRSAFYNCTSLISCTINGNGNTVIGSQAFYQCSALENLVIENVAEIGQNAFYLASYSSVGNMTCTIVGNGSTTIDQYAFGYCEHLTNCVIGSGVTSIGNFAFMHCYSLTSCTMAMDVTTIATAAFASCSGLTSINIPDSVTSIGAIVFSGCSNLSSVSIGSGITNIGATFVNCSGLSEIFIAATTPPTLNAEAFSNTNNCPIYVPCASVNSYKAASVWSNYASRITCLDTHDYVEIGGIKWATMNIGATDVTDAGLYFQWGDTSGYTAAQVGTDKNFTWNDYKYGNGTTNPGETGMTKYNSTDGLTTLQASDDAAQANWGGSWRMPTTTEFEALGNSVNTAWTADYNSSGVAGIICTDKSDNSKVLFFPICGWCSGGSLRETSSFGGYWSSSLTDYDYDYESGLHLAIYDETPWWDYADSRSIGLTIRPILGS